MFTCLTGEIGANCCGSYPNDEGAKFYYGLYGMIIGAIVCIGLIIAGACILSNSHNSAALKRTGWTMIGTGFTMPIFSILIQLKRCNNGCSRFPY